MKKYSLNLFLYLAIPVVISFIIGSLFHLPILLISGIFYSILCFILTPSGDFITTSSDYETKKINPHYRVPTTEKIKMSHFDTIRFVLLFLFAALSLYFFFFK